MERVCYDVTIISVIIAPVLAGFASSLAALSSSSCLRTEPCVETSLESWKLSLELPMTYV